METSLKTGFAQIFSCCPKKLSCPKFGGAAASLAPPPGPYAYVLDNIRIAYEGVLQPRSLIVNKSSLVIHVPRVIQQFHIGSKVNK